MTTDPVMPLPGPLDAEPLADLRAAALALGLDETQRPSGTVARAMLATAVEGLPLGAYDERILGWLSGWDSGTTAAVASLLRRAWTAGLQAGRMEIREEGAGGAGGAR
jgi:hypothetical protein